MASSSARGETDTEPRTKVISLVDMDCFEVQIWQRMYPTSNYWGSPCVVSDKGGRIVSVSYEARDLGINRDMRLPEAKRAANSAQTPLLIFTKPNDREKPDGKSTRYASWEILDSIKEFTANAENVVLEYASSDEFFLDITSEVEFRLRNPEIFSCDLLFEDKTFLEGTSGKISGKELKKRVNERYKFRDKAIIDEEKLVHGAVFIQELLNHVFSKTKFVGSAGIGTNKLMAKLGCSLNKPNGITILPDTSLSRLSEDILIEKVSGLGGKFGSQIKEIFQITTVKELQGIPLEDLENVFGQEKALEAFLKCKGIYDEPVKEKLHSFEVSCAKSFFNQITSNKTLQYHVNCLAEEMVDRLEEERVRHRRKPTTVRATVVYNRKDTPEESHTWSCTIESPDQKDTDGLTKETVDNILKDITFPISALKITKVGLTAKGFRKI